MNNPRVKLFCLTLSLFVAAAATALDFGLVINQEMKTSNEVSAFPNGDLLFSYRPVLRPWLSAPLGQALSLYLSGSIGFDYAGDFRDHAAWRSPPALPELDRAELNWLASPSLSVRLGRQRFQDPAGLVAAGLFDGLSAGFSAAGSRFSLGAWYTGFLYKDTADIVMTRRDQEDYEQPFAQDYFASRRALASLEWEKPDLGPRSSLALGLLGQFDLNGDTNRLHSQYLSARYGLRLPRGFDFRAEAAFGLGEGPGWTVFFAGGLGLNWTPPGPLDSRLSLGGRYSSPFHDRRLRPFTPLSSVPQGQVFSPALPGLSILRGAYTLRPRPPLSLTGECSYFIRTDTVTFQDDREPEKLKGDGYFLGLELYGAARWTPLPDLALTIGGGAFLPHAGNAFTGEAAVRWRAALGIILSL